jgi:hypothetical protein
MILAFLLGAWLGFVGVLVVPHVVWWVWIIVYIVGAIAILRLDRICIAKTAESPG